MFIVWTEHTGLALGSKAKFVRCEKCACEFGYILLRQTQGEATSYYGLFGGSAENRARSRAEELLRHELETGVDPTPCPNCNHLQPDMVEEARQSRLLFLSAGQLRTRLSVAVVFFLISFFLVITGIIPGVSPRSFYFSWLGILVAIFVAPVFRQIWIRFYQPNRLSPAQKASNGYFVGVREEDWPAMMEKHRRELMELGLSGVLHTHAFPRPDNKKKVKITKNSAE